MMFENVRQLHSRIVTQLIQHGANMNAKDM